MLEILTETFPEEISMKTRCEICYKELDTGSLPEHQQSSLCKPIPDIAKRLIIKARARHEYRKRYPNGWADRSREWRDKKIEEQIHNSSGYSWSFLIVISLIKK